MSADGASRLTAPAVAGRTPRTRDTTAPAPANEDVRGPARRPGPASYGQPLAGAPPGSRVGWGAIVLDRLLGDRLLVHVFRLILVAAVVVLALDLRELWRMPVPAYDTGLPALTDLPITVPRTRTPPPNDPRSDPGTLPDAMSVELGTGGTLRLLGTIDVGAADRLAAELDARAEYVSLVELESPGGSVSDALAMSAMLRERRLAVRVPPGALCASSCPIVLAGGAVREVARDANVGVHQIFARGGPAIGADRAMASAQETTALVARHLDAMGIAPALWFHALETPKDELYYLSPDELIDYRLATVLLEADSATSD